MQIPWDERNVDCIVEVEVGTEVVNFHQEGSRAMIYRSYHGRRPRGFIQNDSL